MDESSIAIIDYGMGNLASVYNAFVKTGFSNAKIVSSPDDVRKAGKVILPGVGAFEDAMKNLRASGMDTAIKDSVGEGKPFLGICLGFQLIFERSYENGVFEGLGILEGDVVRFDVSLPVPHMGWNEANFVRPEGIFKQFADRSVYFYFDPRLLPEGSRGHRRGHHGIRDRVPVGRQPRQRLRDAVSPGKKSQERPGDHRSIRFALTPAVCIGRI
jgi:glutamine amidotransferase